MPHMSSVSVGIWVGVGSRYETPRLNGVCHFIEHLLFKGTRKRTAKEISQAVEGVGGYLNAFTSEELTCFHARAGHKRFPELLEVLVDMFLNSRFAPGEIAKEREVIKEEMAMYMDEPQHQVQELLNATLWPGHPLGRPITGTNKSLDGIRRHELVTYLRHNYVPARTLIVAAGNVTHRAVLRALGPAVRRFRGGKLLGYVPASEVQEQPRLKLFTKKTEQTQLALGIRTCSRHDDRRHAVRLLNTILGENMSSRLFQVVREDRGLAYSIYSTPSFFDDTGDLVVSAGLETGNLPKALRLILGELKRFTQQAPSVTELRQARDYVFGQIDLAQESTESQMNWVGEQLLGYGRVMTASQVKRRLSRVTPSELRAAAVQFFRPDRLNLALVSSLSRPQPLQQLLGGARVL